MYQIETELEADGRWIAEIASVPGAMCYGSSREDAVRNVKALCLRVLADRLENGEELPKVAEVFEVVA
jgi:predicted RNase H-like HicB family nuclease